MTTKGHNGKEQKSVRENCGRGPQSPHLAPLKHYKTHTVIGAPKDTGGRMNSIRHERTITTAKIAGMKKSETILSHMPTHLEV